MLYQNMTLLQQQRQPPRNRVPDSWPCKHKITTFCVIHFAYSETASRKLTNVYFVIHAYCHEYGVRVTKITGSSSDDWIYWHFGYSFP
jgi:hypothetical protein